LLKSPNSTNIVCGILIVVVLEAIIEILPPGAAATVLGRTPIVVAGKTAKSI
jgi:hypothetical protein